MLHGRIGTGDVSAKADSALFNHQITIEMFLKFCLLCGENVSNATEFECLKTCYLKS